MTVIFLLPRGFSSYIWLAAVSSPPIMIYNAQQNLSVISEKETDEVRRHLVTIF